MVKALGDQAAALPQMPLHILDFAKRSDLSTAEPPPDVAIEIVCRALTEAADAHGLPVGFFARLIWTESRFRQRVVSHAGAQGVAQFMPATAAEYGLADPFDPVQALPASARFLSKLRDQFGNLGLAAAAYNAGGGRVQDWLARRKTLPMETQNYVRAVTGHSAETWTRDTAELGLEHKLPRSAPCEGEKGLSTQSKPIAMKAALSSVAGEMVRKAQAEAEAARKAKLEAERRALALRKSKKGKPVLLAKTSSRLAAKPVRKIKLAAAGR
ncbi:MAG: hypothetical protein A4S14_12155 [Proteobacteria bacterium SG_bin9]|nr:MAG: hypothetical protein A4S14_12155 [Proteobacteria bacterium SG_bin9]